MCMLSLVLLFLNFTIFYVDIRLELRNYHSRTYIKKNCKGLLNKLFFIPFLRDVNKIKYSLMIINYILSFIGFIIQILLSFNLVSDRNPIIICLFRFMIIYAVTLFIYKNIINRIFMVFCESSSFATIIIAALILIYAVIFVVIPIYKQFFIIA